MTIGYITSDRALSWIPNYHKSIIKQVLRDDQEVFSRDWNNVKVHRCKECNKMIIDLNDEFNRPENR